MTKIILVLGLLFSQFAFAAGDDESDPRFEVRALGGMHFDSYTLSGSGFTASAPTVSGNFYGGDFRFNPRESTVSYRVGYRGFQSTRSSLGAGISPASIVVKNTQISGAVYLKFFADSARAYLRNLKFGLGYSLLSRATTETTPNAVITSNSQNGLSLFGSYVLKLPKDFSADFDLRADLPSSFSESGQKTGYYKASWIVAFEAQVAYPISPTIDVAAGVFAQRQTNSFTGTGTRAAINASESQTFYGVPFSVRFHF